MSPPTPCGARTRDAFCCISTLAHNVTRRFIILKLTIVLRSSSLRVAVVVVVTQFNSRFSRLPKNYQMHHNQPPPSSHAAPQGNGRTCTKMARRCTVHSLVTTYAVSGPPRNARAPLWRRRPRQWTFLKTGYTKCPLNSTLFCKSCV